MRIPSVCAGALLVTTLLSTVQPSTMLSLLTPEYQKRMVQGIYHES
jgi:hypothetical protein